MRLKRGIEAALELFNINVKGTSIFRPHLKQEPKTITRAEYRRRVERIRADVDRYYARPSFSGVSPSNSIHLAGIPMRGVPGDATEAAEIFFYLGQDGYLDRLRKCNACGKWFYARVIHKFSCSVACQQKYFRTSKEWKERRAKYMRDYRRLQATRNVR